MYLEYKEKRHTQNNNNIHCQVFYFCAVIGRKGNPKLHKNLRASPRLSASDIWFLSVFNVSENFWASRFVNLEYKQSKQPNKAVIIM